MIFPAYWAFILHEFWQSEILARYNLLPTAKVILHLLDVILSGSTTFNSITQYTEKNIQPLGRASILVFDVTKPVSNHVTN